MEIRAAIKRCGLRPRQSAHTGTCGSTITIEKDSLRQVFTHHLSFLQTSHICANEVGKGAPFGDVMHLATEPFVLNREAGQERLNKFHFAVR